MLKVQSINKTAFEALVTTIACMQTAKLSGMLKSWLNPSANQCTKASSASCCVDRLCVIKSDWFKFPFILTRHAIGRRILEFSQVRGVYSTEHDRNQSLPK